MKLVVKFRTQDNRIVEVVVPSLKDAKIEAAELGWTILSITKPAQNGWPAMTFTTFE